MSYQTGMGIDASVAGNVRQIAVSHTLMNFARNVAQQTARGEAALDDGYVDVAPGLSGGAIAVLVLAGLAAVGSAGYLVYTMTSNKEEK
jgi:hypothetical protein